VGFLVLSALLLVAFNPALRTSLASSLLAPKAQAPIELVVAHTNDTWGYTQPCG
jgi:2',3'-cyclic-nucleotide 2'-phosphodiesterase (5'-nucleotidase family)